MAEAAECPLLLFVKEDEDLYPNLDYSPIRDRVSGAMAAIERAKERRQGKGLIFAPHITGTPHEMQETLQAVIEAGATGVMFSETFAGGTVRMVREATKHLPNPPAIYGHNAGIGVENPRRHLARGDRPVGPARRRRYPPDRPRPARTAVPPPLRRRMGGLRRDFVGAICRASSRP